MPQAVWVCASCGAQHDENDPPCTQCAGEKFARLEDTGPQRVSDVARVEYVCTDCGRRHNRNNPPCRKCGGMNFRTVRHDVDEDQPEDPTADSVTDEIPDVQVGDRRITGTTVFAYLVAALLLLLAVGYSRFPFAALVFVAGAAIAAPAPRRWIGSKTGYSFSTGAIIMLVILDLVVAIGILAVR